MLAHLNAIRRPNHGMSPLPRRLPIEIPRRAVFLRSLRTSEDGRRCCLAYSDRDGHLHEKPISFAAAARLLKWLSAHRVRVPLQVRRL